MIFTTCFYFCMIIILPIISKDANLGKDALFIQVEVKNMAASTVTGRGQGMSKGKQKIENHGSCPCGIQKQHENQPQIIKKNNCYLNYRAC
jgi:hypothetical protein